MLIRKFEFEIFQKSVMWMKREWQGNLLNSRRFFFGSDTRYRFANNKNCKLFNSMNWIVMLIDGLTSSNSAVAGQPRCPLRNRTPAVPACCIDSLGSDCDLAWPFPNQTWCDNGYKWSYNSEKSERKNPSHFLRNKKRKGCSNQTWANIKENADMRGCNK